MLSSTTKVRLVFWSALMILTLVSFVAFQSIVDLADSSHRLERTHRVLEQLDSLDGLLRDADAARRGYLSVGDDADLAAYQEQMPHVTEVLATLRTMLASDVGQQRRIDSVTPMMDSAITVMRQAMALGASEGGARGAVLAALDRGTAPSRAVRSVVGSMKATELKRLQTRWVSQRISARQTALMIVFGFLLASGILLVVTMRLEHNLAERLQAERHALEAKQVAESASRAKSEFLARMSHELRTPLNSVIGFSGVLIRNRAGHLQEQEITYLERIRDNGMHLLSLIDEILDLTKIEAGKQRLMLASVDIGQLLMETVAQLEGRLIGKDVFIRIDAPAQMAPIESDRGKLKQVLINLLANAIKWTDAGSITLRVHVDGGVMRPVRIDVIDTGIGIAEEHQEAIFEAFEQVGDWPARQHGGTGLGLTISRSLCQLMGYDLTVASKAGAGSTFSIIMDVPVTRPRAGEAPAAAPAGGDGYAADTRHPAALRPT
ncbi:MAG TPA: ATP-binding protein [Gemmatimonadaceae bacterium]|nr:ATP-binding protein [Gemmatimonadaceae bacterium]